MDSRREGETAGKTFSEALQAELVRLDLQLGTSQDDAFERYRTLLERWNDRAGLTAIREPAEVARRLFGESLALLVALRDAGILTPGTAARVADIGPGGGFPGLPMQVAAPELEVVLIESQRRRCDFLETVVGELALDRVEVINARAEDAGRDERLRESFDLVVARAVAPLAVLVEYALTAATAGRRARHAQGQPR